MLRRSSHRGRPAQLLLWFSLALLVLPACHLFFPFELPSVDAAGDAAAGEQGLARDLRSELGAADGRGEGLQPIPCVNVIDAKTLALYTFEDASMLLRDTGGKHHGTAVGKLSSTPSRKGCGQALAIPYVSTTTDAPDHGVIPHHVDWDNLGAVDLWVRFDSPPPINDVGVLSRDATGTKQPGHLGIYRLCNGAIYMRLQHPTGIAYHCSAPVPDKAWIYIGVNVGAPAVQLYVDGKLATPAKDVTCPDETYPCTATGQGNTANNANPWVLGASSGKSVEGGVGPLHSQMHGALDSLRFSADRRPFAGP